MDDCGVKYNFEHKNENLFDRLIYGKATLTDNLSFYETTFPESLEFSDELYKLSDIIGDEEAEELVMMKKYVENAHFVYGYKMGARAIIELLNN